MTAIQSNKSFVASPEGLFECESLRFKCTCSLDVTLRTVCKALQEEHGFPKCSPSYNSGSDKKGETKPTIGTPFPVCSIHNDAETALVSIAIISPLEETGNMSLSRSLLIQKLGLDEEAIKSDSKFQVCTFWSPPLFIS